MYDFKTQSEEERNGGQKVRYIGTVLKNGTRVGCVAFKFECIYSSGRWPRPINVQLCDGGGLSCGKDIDGTQKEKILDCAVKYYEEKAQKFFGITA